MGKPGTKQHEVVNLTLFEHECALLIQHEFTKHYPYEVRLYDNMAFEMKGIDGIVVICERKDMPDSTAYLIQAETFSPSSEQIADLLDYVELFQKYFPTSPRFIANTKVVPILAGKEWTQNVIDECASKGIWRIATDDNGLQIIKSIQTLKRKLEAITMNNTM